MELHIRKRQVFRESSELLGIFVSGVCMYHSTTSEAADG